MSKELKKLLIIDDDEDIQKIVKFSFQDLKNVECFYALSGEEGIRLAVDNKPDLILLDVMMPNMDGIATLQAIKLLPSIKNTLVVFLTARAQKKEINKYLDLGIVDVIVKPFDPMSLGSQIKSIWDKHG